MQRRGRSGSRIRSSAGTPCSSPQRLAATRRSDSVSGRNDAGVFHHENHGSLESAGAVEDSLGNNEALPGAKGYRSILEIDEELAFQHVEEFVVLVVFMPVVFPEENA